MTKKKETLKTAQADVEKKQKALEGAEKKRDALKRVKGHEKNLTDYRRVHSSEIAFLKAEHTVNEGILQAEEDIQSLRETLQGSKEALKEAKAVLSGSKDPEPEPEPTPKPKPKKLDPTLEPTPKPKPKKKSFWEKTPRENLGI